MKNFLLLSTFLLLTSCGIQRTYISKTYKIDFNDRFTNIYNDSLKFGTVQYARNFHFDFPNIDKKLIFKKGRFKAWKKVLPKKLNLIYASDNLTYSDYDKYVKGDSVNFEHHIAFISDSIDIRNYTFYPLEKKELYFRKLNKKNNYFYEIVVPKSGYFYRQIIIRNKPFSYDLKDEYSRENLFDRFFIRFFELE